MGVCGTNSDDHCCWLALEDGGSEPCPFLERASGPPFFWKCSLRVKHKNWRGVHNDPEYRRKVYPRLSPTIWKGRNIGVIHCGAAPIIDQECKICGLHGPRI